MIIDDLVVCPVCQNELIFTDLGRVSCSQCGRTYVFDNGVYDLTPLPPPDKEVLENWSLWEQLQENGSVSYTAEPENNLSVGTRDDAKAFGGFSNLSGLVLDIGCGPQKMPSYGLDFPGQLIGIDPLRGVLPYPQRALAEARRVLKSGGTVNVWLGDDEHPAESNDKGIARYERRMRKAASMLRKGDVAGLLSRLRGIRTAQVEPSHIPEYLEKLKVPNGAVDHFHRFHLNQSELESLLDEVGLRVVSSAPFRHVCNSLFIQAAPIA